MPGPRRWLVTTVVLLGAAVVAGCGGDPDAAEAAAPTLTAQVVQLRRDQVLERVEVTLANKSANPVVVEQLQVRIPGFRNRPPVAKDSPIASGLEVNLPWEYGEVPCPGGEAPDVGSPVVVLRVRAEDGERVVLRLQAADPDGLLQRIAERTCTVRQIAREVDLRFDDSWRLDRAGGQQVLHGTLRATLLEDGALEVSEMAGAIMYGLEPDDTRGPVPTPLASLSQAGDEATIPVVTYAARCDGHTKGEIKKPFEFLVWVGAPGDEPIAVTPTVGDATKQALRQVCAF